jgi:acetoin utilization protein AcuB
MKKNPVTINVETTASEALEIMRVNKVRQLPVVSGGKLAGLVTEKQLLALSPSTATSLNIFEKSYFMEKVMIADVMVRYPLTVTPDTTIEEAALYLREHYFSSVPVVEGEKLAGMITVAEILDTLIKFLGYGEEGSRLMIEAEDRIDLLNDITRIISEFGINVKSVVYYARDNKNVKIKLRLDDTRDTPQLIKAMEKQGLKVSQVSLNSTSSTTPG